MVRAALIDKGRLREASWLESIAVGSQDYIARVGGALGSMANGRKVRKAAEGWKLRETLSSHIADSGGQNGVIGRQNQYFWAFKRYDIRKIDWSDQIATITQTRLPPRYPRSR